MPTNTYKTRNMRRGQALVEFALVLPLLLSLLGGIIDIGFLYNHQLILTNAAREGARLGSLGQSAAQIQAAVQSYLTNSAYTPLPSLGNIAVNLSGSSASVTINSTVPALFSFAGPAVPLSASTIMRLE